jgi:dihydroxyacetone kinase
MKSTKGMTTAFGRAVYVAEEGWEKVPGPGAEGVVALVDGLEIGLL